MVSLLKEQENFLRNAILTVDHSKEVLQCFIDQHLKNNHQTFEGFLNQNQHDIYHLYYDAKCCQCGRGPLQKKKSVLFASQMELLFDKNRQLFVHKTTRRSDFCCCHAKKNVSTAVLDLTLARCLLMNCCIGIFWYGCLDFKGVTLDQFLNSNKHILYHLMKNNAKCCKCQPEFIFPCNTSLIMESEWKKMFSSTLPPCENDRKIPVDGAVSICAFSATPSITVQEIHLELQGIIIQYCCSTRKSVEKLAELRNVTFGHVKKASMSCTEFNTFMSEAEHAILDLATVCGKEDYYKQMLLDLRDKPLDTRMFCQYEKVLLQTISNYEDIIKENEVLKDGMESLKNSNAEMKENIERLCILQTEGSKRQRLIGETSAEIDNHRKDQTYTEIKAVTACLQMLDNSKVLILSGREGSGKSKNSLEILRRIKEKHPETDVIKLKRLTQFSDIIKEDALTVVLFEDVFGRITKQFCENTDEPILDSLYSNINLGNVKVIFVMRDTVKQECQSVLSSHDIFSYNIAYLDLNSEEFRLSLKEKESILINYCTKNEIDIIYKLQDDSFNRVTYDMSIDKIKVSIIDKPDVSCRLSADNKCLDINSWAVEEMIRSDPYQGFPECCRLFSRNKNITKLGATYFRYPLKSLLKEIENMRMEGKTNDVKGLKYVILLYILLNQARSAGSLQTESNDGVLMSINENNIDVLAHQTLFNECYNKNIELKVHDIMYLCEELTCKYLTRKEKKIYFQHQALQDSVLISYSKINPKAIIPLLSFNHMIDIVRTQNYIEQEEEIVIKISKPNYHELAKRIISFIHIWLNPEKLDRFIESKTITDNDVDLTDELVVCAKNNIDTTPSPYPISNESYKRQYFPLYLLRYIGKLDDKTLTVNHTKNQMLISVTIKDKIVSLGVDPSISLFYAFRSKYIDIIEWLLKNTDHSLLDFTNCLTDLNPDRILEYTQLILQNVKHDMIDMTQVFISVCRRSNNEEKPAIDWIMDNVDNSFIDYDKCIDAKLGVDDLETFIDLILYIVNKKRHVCFNINNVIHKCCEYGSTDEWVKVIQNVDHELFEKEELINTVIHYFDSYNDDEIFLNKIVELISPWMKYCDINKLIEKADNCRWYSLLEMLIRHISNSSNVVQMIKNIFKCWDDDDEEEEGEYDYKHIENVFRLLLKYHSDNIGIAEMIMEKACNVGYHCVVEELLLDKFDNISYYLTITLDKCLSGRFDEISVSNYEGYCKLLMLFIQRVDTQFIDLNSLMSDLCNIGHSSAVLWLLENKHSHSFDLKNIMNKASYHGDRELVEYLKQKYKAESFDYKTAMTKACRNSEQVTLHVCKWLWTNIYRDLFDMKEALNNASRCDNYEVVEWILTDVDKKLFDTEAAMFCACEHGSHDTVKLLLDKSGINTFNFQHAITLACKNENNGYTIITKLLYERADKSTIDINAVFSAACKNYRSYIAQWILKTCDQNRTVTETRDRNKHLIKSLDKNLIDIERALTCILNMETPNQNKENDNETKKKLIRIILNKSDPSIIHIYKLLVETCKNDWVDIFQWILVRVDNASLNIGEIINVACHNGAFDIIRWSLKNIDIHLIDVDNVMVESCGFGWLECVVLIWKHCDNYKLQAAMTEACTYGRIHIAEWLLINAYCLFDIPMLLQEAGRNGWINIFGYFLQNVHFDKSDMHNATSQSLEHGHLEIAELGITKLGKEGFDVSSLSENTYVGANKEEVVNFLLHNFDPKSIDIATIMTNACLFGWKDIATFIVDNDFSSRCDLSLAFNTACDNGELEIVQLLLDKVDPHILTSVDKAMHSVALKDGMK